MEREKMIEEIARLICENEKPCYDCLKCTIYDGKICCKYLRIAKKIVNLLIPDGAVILTKEEYERLSSYILEERAREIFYEETKKLKEKIRKETAREIIKDLIGHRFAYYEIDEKYGTYRLLSDYVVDKEDVKFFEDKYGVEVDE